MRFAPWRSERCVAVATARSSLTKNKVGVRLDTSLGFLMKSVPVCVHQLLFPPAAFLGASNCPKGCPLERE